MREPRLFYLVVQIVTQSVLITTPHEGRRLLTELLKGGPRGLDCSFVYLNVCIKDSRQILK